MTRVCCRCKKEKDFSEFPKDSSKKYGIKYYCTECNRAHVKEWSNKNKVRRKEYRDRNKDHIKIVSDLYIKNNKEKIQTRDYKYVKGLPSAYIKKLLKRSGICESEITEQMVELKRSQLKLQRAIKNASS